jgi:hypothetical protein
MVMRIEATDLDSAQTESFETAQDYAVITNRHARLVSTEVSADGTHIRIVIRQRTTRQREKLPERRPF